MKLVSLNDFRARDTVAALQYLLQKAHQGQLEGLVLCARHANGEEEILFTDWYRKQVCRSAYAATHMYWRAMQLQDEIEASRSRL